MPETVTLVVNGVSVEMPAGSMVSAAILKTGTTCVSTFGDGRAAWSIVWHGDLF